MTAAMSEETAARLARLPVVRPVSVGDIAAAVRAGWADFIAAPLFGLFFGAVYALGGVLIVATIALLDLEYLAYPLAAGFALIGPYVAVGLYEVSRARERGEPLSWGSVLGVIARKRRGELSWMAFVMVFALVLWMYQVRLLIAFVLADSAVGNLHDFVTMLFTTPTGWLFLGIGHVIGAIVSLVIFALTVISCPMLLDRDVDVITAMIASVKAVATSPVPMLGWGVLVVLSILGSALLGFVALLMVLPVLGHATWHLYRRAIAPAPAQ